MAEQVRLRGSNQQLRVPRVNFAAEQEIARGRNQLANNLNRLSSFVMSMAEDKAKIEGAEYGALNAPTAEQINDAFVAGEELELPGDDSSVFGRSARRAALSIAGDEISALASNQATTLTTLYEQSLTAYGQSQQFRDAAERDFGITDFSPGALADKLDEVAAGYGGVLDETSPALAREFRAKQGITNHSSYASYLDEYVKVENKRLETNFRAAHQQDFSVPNIAKILRLSTGIDALNKRVQKAKNNAVTYMTGNALKIFLDNMDGEIKTAALQILDDTILKGESPSTSIKNIQKGLVSGFSDSVKNAITVLKKQGMSDTDIAKDLRDERIAQLKFEEDEQEGTNEQAEKDEKIHIGDALLHMAAGDTAKFDKSIAALRITDPVKAAELQTDYEQAGNRRTTSDKDVTNNLTKLGSNITFSNVENNYAKLSNKDLEKFRKDAATFEKEEMQAALAVVRGDLNIPAEIRDLSADDPNFKKVQLLTKITGKLRARFDKAQSEGLSFDGQAIADEVMKEMGTEFEDALTKATIRAGRSSFKTVNNLLPESDKVEVDDFDGMISILKTMRDNKNKRPANFRSASPIYFNRQIESIQKAAEALSQ